MKEAPCGPGATCCGHSCSVKAVWIPADAAVRPAVCGPAGVKRFFEDTVATMDTTEQGG